MEERRETEGVREKWGEGGGANAKEGRIAAEEEVLVFGNNK